MKKFALVGCGSVAGLHAENINRIGKLVAACDAEDDRRKTYTEAYGINGYSSIDDLLATEKEVDVIVVCTPNGLHAEHIIKSLQAGKDVVSESPLCLTRAAAWQIIETEKFCRRRVFLVQPVRYAAALRIKNRLEQGFVNEAVESAGKGFLQKTLPPLAGWRGTLFPGGGLLYSLFSNCLDWATLWYGDLEVVNVSVATDAKDGEVESNGSALLRLENGSLARLEWTAASKDQSGQASIALDTENATAAPEREDVEESNVYPLFYDHVAAALDGKDVTVPGLFDGLKTVEVIEKIYKAVR